MKEINCLNNEIKELLDHANNAKKMAFAKYSNFLVGAALKTQEGKIFTGCNIENASYGLTICAERVALFKAYSEGYRNIEKLVVIADVDKPISPCGACRQVISELAPNAKIYLANRNLDKVIETNINELLPYSFEL